MVLKANVFYCQQSAPLFQPVNGVFYKEEHGITRNQPDHWFLHKSLAHLQVCNTIKLTLYLGDLQHVQQLHITLKINWAMTPVAARSIPSFRAQSSAFSAFSQLPKVLAAEKIMVQSGFLATTLMLASPVAGGK